MECTDLLERGELLEPLVVRQIPNPKPLRIKIPVRLQAKIREVSKPVIGLQCIDEFIPNYDPEMEPYYTCNLCGMKGESNGMLSHVTNATHQRKVIEEKFLDDPRFIDLPR